VEYDLFKYWLSGYEGIVHIDVFWIFQVIIILIAKR